MSTEVKRTTARNMLDLKQRIAIVEELKPRLEIVEPGKCRYLDGESDSSMARIFTQTLGFNVNAGNVAGARRDVFGDILPPAAVDRRSRLDVIEARLLALEAKFSELEG